MKSFRDWFNRYRKWLAIALLLMTSYVGIYLLLSAAGQYRPLPSGKVRWSSGGLAITDRSLWQPKGMYLARQVGLDGKKRIRGDLIGCFFAPMILVDRAYWHPTIYYFEE